MYRATLLCYGLLTTLLCWLSTHLVLPNRRWRPRWSDLGFLLVVVGFLAVAYLTQGWWHIPAPKQF